MEVVTKICTKCNENKEFEKFGRAKFGKYGLKSICRECKSKEDAVYADKNPEKIASYGKQYREENKEVISAQRALHTIKNKERLSQYQKQWRLNNPGKSNARTARRRAQKRAATPKWLTEDHWTQIECFYIESAKLTQSTGIPHEVDHIEPVMGKDRKGLHVPWNLRVITRSENRKKSRKIL